MVTSGNFSPVLQCGIALGFVPPRVEIGDTVEIDVRGDRMPAEVVKTPFVTALAPTPPVLRRESRQI